MTELQKRSSDFHSTSPDQQERIDANQRSDCKEKEKDVDSLTITLLKQLEISEQENENWRKNFSDSPPSDYCHKALLAGILFYTEPNFPLHDITPYFSIDHESVYIWTHARNHISNLIVDVDPAVKSLNVWRNLASILELTEAISYNFEYLMVCDYQWIYNFDPKTSIEDSEFLYPENFYRQSGLQLNISYFADNASLIELLHRDEKFYVMGMNLLASFYNHNFCLICAFRKDGYKEHPNHDLPTWEVAQAIPGMEAAIVQATKAVEAILGKPGKRDDPAKYQRILDRWNKSIDLDPQDVFGLVNKSYIDYYYEMFGVRGNAAHSLGSLPYKLSRQLTIEAQCFAWILLKSYFSRYSLNNAAAKKYLNFNKKLIEGC